MNTDDVFRDLAQGAFRMRKIGQGQRLTLHIIPEVHQLICNHSNGVSHIACAVAGASQAKTYTET